MDLERIRYVTSHYYDLHGLRWVVWGIVCFAVAAEDVGWLPTWVMLAVVLPLGLGLFFGASAYYARKYGFVKSAPGGSLSELFSNLLVIGLLVLSFVIDKKLGVRPFVQPFVFAGWFLVMFWLKGRDYRAYYLWIAIAICAANILLAMVQVNTDSPLLHRGFVTWNLAGIALIVGGIFDHLLITGTFQNGQAAHE